MLYNNVVRVIVMKDVDVEMCDELTLLHNIIIYFAKLLNGAEVFGKTAKIHQKRFSLRES